MALGLCLAAIAGGLGAEVLARGLMGGELSPPLYAQTADGHVHLKPGARARARSPSGGFHAVEIDDQGRRAPSATPAEWWIAGDSLAFGLGLEGSQTIAARLGTHGRPSATVAAPGYSTADALRELDRQLHRDRPLHGIVLVPNLADDDRQLDPRWAAARTVVEGRLLRRDAPALVRQWARTPLVRSLLLQQLARGVMATRGAVLGPGWREDPARAGPAYVEIGQQLRAFASDHPDTDLRVAWIPWPHAPDPGDRQLAGLRDGLGDRVPVLDLSDQLLPGPPASPPGFLPGDSHLSAAGADRVAVALADWLPETR